MLCISVALARAQPGMYRQRWRTEGLSPNGIAVRYAAHLAGAGVRWVGWLGGLRRAWSFGPRQHAPCGCAGGSAAGVAIPSGGCEAVVPNLGSSDVGPSLPHHAFHHQHSPPAVSSSATCRQPARLLACFVSCLLDARSALASSLRAAPRPTEPRRRRRGGDAWEDIPSGVDTSATSPHLAMASVHLAHPRGVVPQYS